MLELEEILYHLQQIQEHMNKIEEIREKAYNKVGIANKAQQELLHLIENQPPSGANMLKTYSNLRKVRGIRRDNKDIVAIISSISNPLPQKAIKSAIKAYYSNMSVIEGSREFTPRLTEQERMELYGE